jgi:hypothetical protein
VEEVLARGSEAGMAGVLAGVDMMLGLLAYCVLQEQPPLRRKQIENLIGEYDHQRSVLRLLINNKVVSNKDFECLWQIHFYYDPKQTDVLKQLMIHMADTKLKCFFEYLTEQQKLVPMLMTDRCYLTMIQALEARLGGSTFGPAGTGETETVKALCDQLGRFVLVFNCDEAFDFQAMGRIFVGLYQAGAWECFDEFNRLEERTLSAVSQQIQTIQETLKFAENTKTSLTMELVGKQVRVMPDMAIFINMNTTYAGRSNLPDNLKKLFRSMAMTAPDSTMIAEVTFFSQGFRTAEKLALKIVPFFPLCDDQQSQQSHYDFNLKALKSVLASASIIKTDPKLFTVSQVLLLRSGDVERNPGPPSLPQGWERVEENGKVFFITPVLDTGRRVKIQNKAVLESHIQRGLVHVEMRQVLQFGQSRKRQHGQVDQTEGATQGQPQEASRTWEQQQEGGGTCLQQQQQEGGESCGQQQQEGGGTCQQQQQEGGGSRGQQQEGGGTCRQQQQQEGGGSRGQKQGGTIEEQQQQACGAERNEDKNNSVTVVLHISNGGVLVEGFSCGNTVGDVLRFWEDDLMSEMPASGAGEQPAVRFSATGLLVGMEEMEAADLASIGAVAGEEIHLTHFYEVIEILNAVVSLGRNTKKKYKEEEVVDRLLLDDGQKDSVSIKMVTSMMNMDRLEEDNIVQEFDAALNRCDSPFTNTEFPLNRNQNHYCRVILWAREHCPGIYKMLLSLRSPDSQFSDGDVAKVANILSQLAVFKNKKNSAIVQLRTVMLQSGGLTNNITDATSKVNMCQSSRNFRKIRQNMACLSEQLLHKIKTIPQFVLDNMNFVLNYQRLDHTLSVLLFKEINISGLDKFNTKTLEEKLELFDIEHINLRSEVNTGLLYHLKHVMKTVLTDLLVNNFKGFKWTREHYPEHHYHPTCQEARKASTAFTEKPYYLNEMKALDMVSILQMVQDRYFELLISMVEDDGKLEKCIRKVKTIGTPVEETKTAEIYIRYCTQIHGELIIHGDQLTMDRVISAVKLQKPCVTAYGRLEYICITQVGMFHAEMSYIIHNFAEMMPAEASLKDLGSLAWFKSKLSWNHITNNADKIKECGNFECHRQFFEKIGSEYIIEAVRNTLENEKLEKTKVGLDSFFHKVISENHLDFVYNPDTDDPLFFDDVAKNASNLASRALLSLVMHKVEREGDSKGIQAVRRVLMMFAFNVSGANSNYMPTLMYDMVNYMGASDATRRRIDELVTSNITGGTGTNIHQDKLEEQKVKLVKGIMTGLHRNFSDALLEVSVAASNVIEIVVNHELDSIGAAHLKTGGEHASKMLSVAESVKIRSLIRKLKVFDVKDQGEVTYSQKCPLMWSRIDMTALSNCVDQKRKLYRSDNTT